MKGVSLVSVCLLSAGCMVGPTWGTWVDDHTHAIDFNLYAIKPSAKMTLECSTPWWVGTSYQQFAEVTASATALITVGGGSIYVANVSRVVPEACWGSYHGTEVVTDIRPKQDGWNAAVFDDAGLDCAVHEVLVEHKSPIDAGQDCRLKYQNSNTPVEFAEVYARK
jgi:hypothetical protein